MEKSIPEKFLPTHIVAAAGAVLNGKGEMLLEDSARPIYLEYVTKPNFELKTKRIF